jgi:hypothetical protein
VQYFKESMIRLPHMRLFPSTRGLRPQPPKKLSDQWSCLPLYIFDKIFNIPQEPRYPTGTGQVVRRAFTRAISEPGNAEGERNGK